MRLLTDKWVRATVVSNPFMPQSDLELFDSWHSGNADAGERLFERYFQSMYRFFASKLDRDVEELVQATFLACVKSRDRFHKKASFRTFLFGIARRVFLRHLRDHYSKGRALDFGVTSLVDLGTQAQNKLVKGEERQQLMRALSMLPVEQQLLLELYYWQEMSTQELSEVFEVAPATIGTRLFRAREALRDHLGRLADQPRPDSESVQGFDTWARSLEQRSETRQRSRAAERIRRNRS